MNNEYFLEHPQIRKLLRKKMKPNKQTRQTIDNMTYQQLWSEWRFFPSGEYVREDAGKYLQKALIRKRNEYNISRTNIK